MPGLVAIVCAISATPIGASRKRSWRDTRAPNSQIGAAIRNAASAGASENGVPPGIAASIVPIAPAPA